MQDIVPGALQRLRAADIVRMTGLTAAALGQEYSRTGAVRNMQRQGMCLSGVVDISHSPIDDDTTSAHGEIQRSLYVVEVELQSNSVWVSRCECSANTNRLCSHAAAVLYQWLAYPSSFVTATPAAQGSPAVPKSREIEPREGSTMMREMTRPSRSGGAIKPIIMQGGPAPIGDLVDMLGQLGLSDLRTVAREYEITTNGMSKQLLAEKIQEALKQPEAIRRVAATLEKPSRQLLAALTLAGGAMSDDDLRGLYERFSLGQPAQYQHVIGALQNRGLLFRTSLNNPLLPSRGLGGVILDIGWYVPEEVRAALRVTVPVTSFNIETNGEVADIQQVEPLGLLADLLLVARTLNGYHLEHAHEWRDRDTNARLSEAQNTPLRSTGVLPGDGAVSIPPPVDTPSPALMNILQSALPHTPAFLRFAVRLLRLTDILHKDDDGSPYLRTLPDAAQLLLGEVREEVARDLFELWLTRASYEELFDLQEEGLQLRCRSTPLNQPMLRPGELDAENCETRQLIVRLLTQVPLDQWINFAGFARFIYRLNPLFLQRRQRFFSAPHWWLEYETGRPLRPLQLSDWSRAELHYLTRLLTGPLHWWGLCDVAFAQDGRLLAFRLTPVAGWLFNGTPLHKEGKEPSYEAASLEIGDAEEILVTCSPRAWTVIELMEIFAEVTGVRQRRLCYRLTPKALSQALSQGHQPTPLLKLLRAVQSQKEDGQEQWQRLVSQLERWIASYGRVRLYTGVAMLEAADAGVMRELKATTSLEEQIVQSIHPTLLILKKQGAERMVDDLKRRGQSPLLHEEEEMYGAE
jgi:hypothetical protein